MALKLPFEMGVAHYDAPPPDTISDIDAFIGGDNCRFANQLGGWIDVEDGKIVGHGVTGMGRIGSSTLRVRGRALTFAAIPLPDLTTVKRI
ncbi:MAG: hypothetical protein WCB04_10615, partial [Mycobacteriales bacterium]